MARYYTVDNNLVSGFWCDSIHEVTEGMIETTEDEILEWIELQGQGYTLCALSADGTVSPQLLGVGDSWDGETVNNDDDAVLEVARDAARDYRDNTLFPALIKLEGSIMMGRTECSDDEKAAINAWVQEWKDLPAAYTDSSTDITDLYPDTPDLVEGML
ncbi:MAG: hypothetical protein ACN2B6_12200 [Rickettsiales bacterium]